MTNIFHKIFYRPSLKPSVPLPLGTRSVGHYCVPPNWKDKDNGMKKYFVELSWTVSGKGQFVIKGQEYVLKEDHIIVYFPGDTHHISSLNKPWDYYLITFDGVNAVDIINSFGISGQRPYYAGPCPIELFTNLAEIIEDSAPGTEYRVSAAGYQILTNLSENIRSSHSKSGFSDLSQKCISIISKKYHDPAFSVSSLARELNMHRSRLCRDFHKQVGMPPSKYICNFRMHKAITLLREIDMSISEVAYATGYNHPAFFTRCIVAATGFPPSKLRGAATKKEAGPQAFRLM